MDKRLYICAAVILFLGVLGLLAYTQLEIYPRKERTRPSQDALANNYFAMEKWLNETGHPVRIEKRCSPQKITEAQEKVVIVQSSAGSWEDAGEIISPWIENGGHLVISLDYDKKIIDEDLFNFLSGFGILVNELSGSIEDDDKENDTDNLLDFFPGIDTNTTKAIPDFDRDVYFFIDHDVRAFIINDNRGITRLAEIFTGDGTLTVISKPLFMYNYYLKKDINARLTWYLTGARANNAGVFFVRDRHVSKALFGKIMERGNMIPVGISAFLVIFLGFWTVIPLFGLVYTEKQKTARPIRERFTAEIRFLRKYRALDYYIKIYEREHHVKDSSPINETYNYRELINRLKEFEPKPEGIKWNR
ncbi:MAG: hypothetical protein LBH44_08115 [Treponema sp.]|jgi:hypothetical protein|nr:hypothetical protein [Treponema sp.]